MFPTLPHGADRVLHIIFRVNVQQISDYSLLAVPPIPHSYALLSRMHDQRIAHPDSPPTRYEMPLCRELSTLITTTLDRQREYSYREHKNALTKSA